MNWRENLWSRLYTFLRPGPRDLEEAVKDTEERAAAKHKELELRKRLHAARVQIASDNREIRRLERKRRIMVAAGVVAIALILVVVIKGC